MRLRAARPNGFRGETINATAASTLGLRKARRLTLLMPWVKRVRTIGDYTTCLGMWPNGSWMVTWINYPGRNRTRKYGRRDCREAVSELQKAATGRAMLIPHPRIVEELSM